MVIVYVFGIIILLIVLLSLLFLLVPIKYKFDCSYEHSLQANLWVRFIVLFKINVSWDSARDEPGQLKVSILGFSFYLQPGRGSKEEQKQREKEKGGLFSGRLLVHGIDRELLGNGATLFWDILKILRPEKIVLRGKVGFDEPHLTGWLTAFGYMIKGLCKDADVFLEPVWHEEYYKIKIFVEGRVVSVMVLWKVARFMLSRRTRQFLKIYKKEKVLHVA